jgi:hypothetical protein
MMAAGKADRTGHGGDRRSRVSEEPLKPSLIDARIDKNLAHRARQFAASTAARIRSPM